jgi:hypothetical protein
MNNYELLRWARIVRNAVVLCMVVSLQALAQAYPCEGLTGVWGVTGNGWNGIWNVTYNVSSGQITGTYTGPCTTWNIVSGSSSFNPSTGVFSVRAAGSGCADTFVQTAGTISPTYFCAGGDTTSTNDFGSSATFSEQVGKPSSETTTSSGYWGNDYPGTIPANRQQRSLHIFNATVAGPTANYKYRGRYFRETNYNTGTDSCHFTNSLVPESTGLPYQAYVGQVDYNQHYIDIVGWTEAAVIYYREQAKPAVAKTSFPCSFVSYQQMEMADAAGSDISGGFKHNELSSTLDWSGSPGSDATNDVARDGVTANKTFPRLGKATNFNVAWNAGTSKFDVTWTNNSPDADDFALYTKVGKDGVWELHSFPSAATYCGGGSCAYSVSGGWPGHVYYFKVIPNIGIGGTLFGTGPESDDDYACSGGCAIAGTGTFDAKGSPYVTYAGSWANDNNSYPSALGSTLDYSNNTGSWAAFSFVGSSVDYVYLKYWHMGKADVWIDGVFMETVDGYDANPTGVWQPVRPYSLTSGAHTIAIEVKGTNTSPSTDTYIVIDGFDVN